MIGLLRLISSVVAMATVAAAQASPLPPDMVASFGSEHTWAEQLYLPVANENAFVRARLTFENAAAATKCVKIDWFFQAPGALPRSSHESFEVSFRPTAIARRAGTTLTFYVVGWSERTGQVIVESWTLPTSYLLGASIPQGGGAAISEFSHPAFVREVEWTSASSSMQPIWDAACQPFSNQLLLLPRATPTQILALDLSSRVVTLLYSSSSFTALAGDRNIVIGKNSLAGFIAMTSRRRQWEHGGKVPPNDEYFVMYDSDSNGVFESTATVQVDSLSAVIPGEWDDRYEE